VRLGTRVLRRTTSVVSDVDALVGESDVLGNPEQGHVRGRSPRGALRPARAPRARHARRAKRCRSFACAVGSAGSDSRMASP
jgi:hypothetical protein